MSFLEKIETINDFSPRDYVPLMIGGDRVGFIRNDNAPAVLAHAAVFHEEESGAIAMNPALDSFEKRTAAMEPVVADLDQKGLFAFPLKEEMFPVVTQWGRAPLLQIDRNATILFGVRVFGLHVNGYTWRDGSLHMWVGRRGAGLKGWPNMLDQMVAGGQPIGLGLRENLVKEGLEEAQIPREIMDLARAAGTVSYAQTLHEGTRQDTLFIYDLEMPQGAEPVPDGEEVGAYYCLPIEEVAEIVRDRNDFKTNCHLVVIDFLVRHGILTPDNEPDYVEIVRRLRSL